MTTDRKFKKYDDWDWGTPTFGGQKDEDSPTKATESQQSHVEGNHE